MYMSLQEANKIYFQKEGVYISHHQNYKAGLHAPVILIKLVLHLKKWFTVHYYTLFMFAEL